MSRCEICDYNFFSVHNDTDNTTTDCTQCPTGMEGGYGKSACIDCGPNTYTQQSFASQTDPSSDFFVGQDDGTSHSATCKKWFFSFPSTTSTFLRLLT